MAGPAHDANLDLPRGDQHAEADSDTLPWPVRGDFGLSDADRQVWLQQQKLAELARTPPIFAGAVAVLACIVALLLWLGKPEAVAASPAGKPDRAAPVQVR